MDGRRSDNGYELPSQYGRQLAPTPGRARIRGELAIICMDGQPVQLVRETRVPLPGKSGQPMAVDYEYERNGTATIFLFTEPLAGGARRL